MVSLTLLQFPRGLEQLPAGVLQGLDKKLPQPRRVVFNVTCEDGLDPRIRNVQDECSAVHAALRLQ